MDVLELEQERPVSEEGYTCVARQRSKPTRRPRTDEDWPRSDEDDTLHIWSFAHEGIYVDSPAGNLPSNSLVEWTPEAKEFCKRSNIFPQAEAALDLVKKAFSSLKALEIQLQT